MKSYFRTFSSRVSLLSVAFGLILSSSTYALAPYVASDVLGQPDFSSNQPTYESLTASGLDGPTGIAIDEVHDRVFVADGTNHRVLVYDKSALANNMSASYVLGQPDFSSNSSNTSASGFNAPRQVEYDPVNDRLFVSEYYNNRILVFDTTAITNNESAVNVLGQANFTTGTSHTTASGLYHPDGMSIDTDNNRLFVADQGNNRVVVFDTTVITDNEPAVNVFGQTNFTSGPFTQDTNAQGFYSVSDVVYDPISNRIFVADFTNSRVLVFDTTVITNNENAVNVLGQANFTTGSFDTNAQGFATAGYVELDSANNRLFVTDVYNQRVLIFDITVIVDNENAVNVLGQPDFTTGDIPVEVNANGFQNHNGAAYDAENEMYYISDSSRNRVLIFDVSGVIDNEPAVNVLGQPDFTHSYIYGIATPDAETSSSPAATALDEEGHRLFVSDSSNCRILVHNLSSTNQVIDRVADNVLGQPGMIGRDCESDAESLYFSGDIAYDSINDRLFVVDISGCRVMVFDTATVVDGEAAVNVLGADDPSLSGSCEATRSTFGDEDEGDAYSALAYDESREYLYVDDSTAHHRILVFDLSGGITDGMDAYRVIGASNFTSVGSGSLSASGISSYATSLEIDSDNQRLFIAESERNRILVFDVNTITNGESAVAVLGQANFTSSDPETSATGLSGPNGLGFDPEQDLLFVAEDAEEWNANSRIIYYDVTRVTNGEAAIGVIGANDLDSVGDGSLASTTTLSPNGRAEMDFDSVNRRMYYADTGNNRVLAYDFVNITTTSLPDGELEAAYSETIDYEGDQGTVEFSLTDGKLPRGLTLNTSTGVISGTPSKKGAFDFTITLSDNNDGAGTFVDEQAYSLTIGIDSDDDGIDDDIEVATPLGTDVNDDAISDELQPIVTTSFNEVVDEYTTVVVDNCTNGFEEFANNNEADLEEADDDYRYPLGMQSFTADCGTVGATANFTQYLDAVYDTSEWEYRKYLPDSGFVDFTENVTFGEEVVNGVRVTTVNFSITDGSMYDTDGLADGRISDPIGAALPDGATATADGNETLADTGVPVVVFQASGLVIIAASLLLTKLSRNRDTLSCSEAK